MNMHVYFYCYYFPEGEQIICKYLLLTNYYSIQ